MGKPDVGLAYTYAVLMFVFPMVGAVALVHSNRIAIHVQIRLRAQLTSAVYRKALCLSSRCAGFRAQGSGLRPQGLRTRSGCSRSSAPGEQGWGLGRRA